MAVITADDDDGGSAIVRGGDGSHRMVAPAATCSWLRNSPSARRAAAMPCTRGEEADILADDYVSLKRQMPPTTVMANKANTTIQPSFLRTCGTHGTNAVTHTTAAADAMASLTSARPCIRSVDSRGGSGKCGARRQAHQTACGIQQQCLKHDKCGHLGRLKCGARQAVVTCSALSITRAVNATVWPPLPLPIPPPSPPSAPLAEAIPAPWLLMR